MEHKMKVIAHIENDFTTKFGIPHQSGVLEGLSARIVFEPEYRNPDALKGLEDFTHIWLVWEFSEAVRDTWSPTVRPPRLGGNVRKGVFATRSPFRPNPIGLSSVRLLGIDYEGKNGPTLQIAGADLMNGTPIFDIKPFLPTDNHPEASGGFTDTAEFVKLQVVFPEELLCKVPEEKREALIAVLSDDPRPRYQKDPERIYGMPYGEQDIHFRVRDQVLTVCDVTKYEPHKGKRL